MDADRLAQLLDDPGRALALTPPEAAALLGRLGGLAEVLRVAAAGRRAQDSGGEHESLLTAEQAGKLLGLSRAQVYRRAHRWPFTRRLSAKTLRFDRAGLDLYLARNSRSRT